MHGPFAAVKGPLLELVAAEFTFLVIVEAGGNYGRHTLSLVSVSPSGERMPLGPPTEIELTSDRRQYRTAAKIDVEFEEAGEYLFEVYVNDHMLTRASLLFRVAAESEGEPTLH